MKGGLREGVSASVTFSLGLNDYCIKEGFFIMIICTSGKQMEPVESMFGKHMIYSGISVRKNLGILLFDVW